MLVFCKVFEHRSGGLLPLRIEIDERIVEDEKPVTAFQKPAGHGETHRKPERGARPGRENGEGNIQRIVTGDTAFLKTNAAVTLVRERGDDLGEMGEPGIEIASVHFRAERLEVTLNFFNRRSFAESPLKGL